MKRPFDNNVNRVQSQANTPTKSNMGERTVNYDFDLSPTSSANEPIIMPEMIPLTPHSTGY